MNEMKSPDIALAAPARPKGDPFVTVRDLDTGQEAIERYDELLISTGASGWAW